MTHRHHELRLRDFIKALRGGAIAERKSPRSRYQAKPRWM
jgi:hypothetical protein